MYLSRTITVSNRRGLVHWHVDEGTYFVTFRLADSLPRGVPRRRTEIEGALDQGHGAAYFLDPGLAEIVWRALRHFDATRYFLHAACVMPNHVHVVLRLGPRMHLSEVVRSWKVFTAQRINAILSRQGALWEREWYDTLICDEHELARATAYVLANPEKAGLVNWRWVGRFETAFVVRYDEGRSETGATP